MSLLVDSMGNPLVADGPQFGPERQAFGPVRFEHQPAWVRSRGRKQKAGNKRAKSMLQRLKDAGNATVDDLAALAGFKTRKSPSKKGGRKSAKRSSRKSSSRRGSSRKSSSRRSSNRRDYRKFLKARKTTFGPVRMSKQPRWVKEAYGKASKAGRKSRRSASRRSARSTWSASRAAGGKKARRSARRYQSRLKSKMSGFQSMLSTRSSLGKRAAARLRRRLYRCGDNARLGSRSKIGRKKSRSLRRELRRCKGRKIRASSEYAGISSRGSRRGRKGSSRRLARSGASGGQLSYAKLMKKLRGTKMKAWVCVGPKRTGCGGGKKGRRGSRVFGVLRA